VCSVVLPKKINGSYSLKPSTFFLLFFEKFSIPLLEAYLLKYNFSAKFLISFLGLFLNLVK